MSKYLSLPLVLLIVVILSFLYSSSTCNQTSTVSTETIIKTSNLPGVYPFTPRVSAQDYVASNPRFSIDKDGILIVDYGEMYGGLGKWHNPLFVAIYANILYAECMRGDKEKAQAFLRQADWLVKNAVDRGRMVVWEYPFATSIVPKPGWISGLTQGVVLSVLVRVHALTGNPKYLEVANRAFAAFETLMEDGGVAAPTSDNGAFYEEAAQPGVQSCKVLNGHIGALVGLWDYYLYTRSHRVLTAFNRGIQALKETLSQFDASGTSYYSLNPLKLAPVGGYNRQHVAQLLWLYDVTKDPIFLKYALKFYAYERPSYQVIAVKGATNPVTHGMENLYLRGATYWSHNEFPTWVELDLGAPKIITGFTMFSGALDSAVPKDYTIEFSPDREHWGNTIKISDNHLRIVRHPVPRVHARYIRITIVADNGNNNVVLRGFGVDVDTESRDPVAIVDWDHFIGKDPSVIVDGNPKTTWTSRDGRGWIIIDLHSQRLIDSVIIRTGFSDRSNILSGCTILTSSEASEWKQVAHIEDNKGTDLTVVFPEGPTAARYVKIELESGDRVSIAEVVVTSVPETLIRSLREVFDELDMTVNEGAGYKDFLNPDGFPTGALLAWSESYLMQAYAEMFRATGDEYYLNKLYEHIKSVMRNRDDFRGQVDYKGNLVPAWGTDRYTKGEEWLHFVVHTGMITYPMLEFVQLVRECGIKRLLPESEAVLTRVKEAIDYHDKDWVLQDSGFGLYTFPEDFYGKSNYVCPLSHQAAMGRSLLLLWKLTGEERYRRKAADIAAALRHSFQETEQGTYVWGVNLGPLSDNNRAADISHSTITVHFVALAHEASIEFTADDMEKLTVTVKRLFCGDRIADRIDGTGDYTYEITAGQYAFLTPYDSEIWKLCHNLLFETYRVDLTAKYFQEDWWGTVMLGIARLASSAKHVEPARR